MATTATSSLTDRDILVCIFQRGAADGLNSVVPYGDEDYYSQRSTIAVPAPVDSGGAIDLDGFYGLHPALAPLKPVFDAGDLALVHATGVPHGFRSHFAAQGLVERGVADQSGSTTGWLGRHLALSTPASSSAFRIVAISGNVPVVLLGADDPLAVSNLAEFGFDQDIFDSGYPAVLADLFRSSRRPAPMVTWFRGPCDVPGLTSAYAVFTICLAAGAPSGSRAWFRAGRGTLRGNPGEALSIVRCIAGTSLRNTQSCTGRTREVGGRSRPSTWREL